MKKIILLLVLFSILGCTKKEIKLPAVAEKGLQELHNHSQIWFFFKVKNNDTVAVVNKKNTIVTTHWVYNIDKRLPLKKITHKLIKLKEKHANSMHSKEGMHNYFSYADTLSKKLSFLKFDKLLYKTDSILSKDFVRKNNVKYKNYHNINLTFNNHFVWLNNVKMEKTDFKNTLLAFIDFTAEGKKTMLHLNFDENTSYQNYLFYKTSLHNLKSVAIINNPIEFIFNKNKVPDCGCE